MDDGTWLHAQLTPPPGRPQARARGEVTVISSDGGVTVEVTVRQLDLPQGAEVALCCDDREVTRFTVTGGSGSHGHTLEPDDEAGMKDGAEVTVRRADADTVGGSGAPAADDASRVLLRGVLRATDDRVG